MQAQASKHWIRVAVALVAAVATLAVAGSAEARWRVLSDVRVNDLQQCRDGVRFAYAETSPFEPGPRDPFITRQVVAILVGSPPAPDTVLANEVLTVPYDPMLVDDGVPRDYNGVFTVRYSTLVPLSATVRLEFPDGSTELDEVQDCYLFHPIDIRPGGSPNNVNPKSRGKLQVAILSTPQLGAGSVNVQSVRFGATGTEAAADKSPKLTDLNRDGLKDLVLSFNSDETGIGCGAKVALLTGTTSAGQHFEGSDSVRTVGCPH